MTIKATSKHKIRFEIQVVFVFLFLFLFSNTFLSQTTVAYTSSGTFVVPYGVTSLIVECYGAGGGGGGDAVNDALGSSGGGGGAYAKSTIAVTAGASYSYSIGTAGTAGTGAGGAGGNTTFNTTTVVAAGGTGGGVNGAAGGAGGTTASSTGDLEYAGGSGETSADVNGRGGGGCGGTASGGNTGGNQAGATAVTGGFAGGAGGTGDGANGAAPTAGQYGGGGGGSGDRNGGSSVGGAGLAGYIKITYTGAATTYTLGLGDNFTSITAARTALEAAGVDAPIIIEIQSDYDESGETYPITFAAVTGASAANTITYRPASGVTALVNGATPASATALITFNGADYIILDGRAAGVGTTLSDIQWTIRNERTAATVGPTINITNDATYNTLRFLNIEGECAGNTQGIVYLSGGPTTGNDYNEISYCTVQDLTTGGTTTFPFGGIVVNGTSEAISDGYLTIDNCHIINISTPTSVSTIFVGGYELSNWTITNNHMYHNSATALPTGIATYWCTFIFVDDGTGHTITGNYMGGTASSCGGTAFTMSGAHTNRGMQFQTMVTGTALTISGNVFRNFAITSTNNVTADNAYLVVFRLSGAADINLTGNTIGSLTVDGSITLTHNNTTALGGIMAIWDNSTATTDISSNSIGGITINAGTSTVTPNAMIHIFSGSSTALTINNNTIGGTLGAGAITVADDIYMRGIYSQRTTNTSITNNIIQNFSLTGDASFIGVFNNVGPLTCTGNTIKDITMGTSSTKKHYLIAHGGNTVTNKIDPSIGTLANSPTISSNSFSNITLSNTSSTPQLAGIYVNASGTITSSSNTLGSTTSNNMSIANNASNYGFYFAGNGTITCSNNTIQQWNLSNTGTTNSFAGIWNSDGTLTACNSNTIKNITTAGEATNYMIGLSTTDNASISSNTIQDITISGTTSTAILRCILASTSGTITCSSNTIGSTTNNNMTIAANSANEGIRLDGTSTAITCNSNTVQEFNLTNTGATSVFYGIYAVTGAFSATSNTVKNIDIAGVGATSTILAGIHCATNSAANSITSNVISDLNATTTSANSPYVRGISCQTGGGGIKKNQVTALTNAATTSPFIYGVMATSGSWNIHNNVILLSNGSIDNNISINGIQDGSTGTMTIYHNTVKIYGTTTNAATTRAFRRTAAGVCTVKNNIFQNTRTGTGAHYAYSATDVTTITTDYNYLEVTDDANALGYWSSTAYTFANWKTAFTGEDNSLNGTNTIAGNGSAAADFTGANLGENINASVADDKSATPRNDGSPWMGAFEGVVALPIKLVSFTGKKSGTNNELKWTTASEQNNDFFTIEKTFDGIDFETVGLENGAGNSNEYLNYSLTDYNARKAVNYYRLKQTDFDGKYDFSEIISIDNSNDETSKEIVLKTNILGQEVNEFYRGIVVIVYSDGSSIKVIQ